MTNEGKTIPTKEAPAIEPRPSESENPPPHHGPKNAHFLVKEMALVGEVATEDVWKWLAAGWSDLKANTAVSASYAALFIFIGLMMSFGFYFMGWPYLILPGLTGFLLVGPAVGIGFYEISRRHAAGEKVSLMAAVTAARHNKLGIFGFGIALAFIFQVWIRISFTVFALNFPGIMPEWHIILMRALSMEGVYFGISIALVGAVFAGCIFFVGAFAMPMMMDRNTILLPSIIASAYAVAHNRNAMILWAAIIVILTGVGLATAGIGLIVTLPLVGHATWHAYKQVMSGDLPEEYPTPPKPMQK
ncbi:DUF2189 domain-containing protein [Sneathiella litorea]|uniref:DUF2189 domain-containing protein n=1 Tax=Sneathiella litorea TaxID=2606216 RepID=A0A6L8WAB3_9PROT|nr:DUF2189 domain-containing protein [Sneathiella litorea]MZR31574.1 DUF2189 domain-containing protein [Sneathiella litorea]